MPLTHGWEGQCWDLTHALATLGWRERISHGPHVLTFSGWKRMFPRPCRLSARTSELGSLRLWASRVRASCSESTSSKAGLWRNWGSPKGRWLRLGALGQEWGSMTGVLVGLSGPGGS